MTHDNKSYNIYYKELMKTVILDQKLVKKYIKGYKKFGDKRALDKICESNYRYVESLAYKRLNSKFNILDLVNEGNIGLIEAIDAFDLSKSNTFLSFAHARIDKRIRMYIDTYSTKVHIPYNVVLDSNKVKSFMAKYELEHSFPPRIEKIAEGTGLALNIVKKALNYINNIKYNEYVDDNYKVDKDDTTKQIEEYFKFLTEEDQELINKVFGTFNNFKVPLEELAEERNIELEELEEQIEAILLSLKNLE